MSQIRRPLTIFLLALAPILTVGCATTPPPMAAYTPQFGYSYPAGEAAASDVTIAIVRPRDATGLTQDKSVGHQHAIAFNAALAAQFQEMFNKKGFKQTGPFDDLNSMTFPDKKGADLALTPEVSIAVTVPNPVVDMRQAVPGVTSAIPVIKLAGPCTASGFVSFVLIEPLSGEKLWVKKVDVPPTTADCTGEQAENDFTLLSNGVGRTLEQVFPAVMKKAWDYLSPEEVTLLKKTSQELRAKKVY
jgi:hypothetical protein